MIRKQDGAFYLFDLGSFNGSYVNGSRVTAARQLNNGDLLAFAQHEYRFKEVRVATPSETPTSSDDFATIGLIRSQPVVLLVSDVKGYTTLSEALEADDLAQIIGGWYADCENILANAGATVDKFIGDCVLAHWDVVNPDTLRASLSVAMQLLASCQKISESRQNIFDKLGHPFEVGVALHSGTVAYGGLSAGEYTLVGDSVNLTFRLESLTRGLGKSVVISGNFLSKLPELRSYCTSHGMQRVKGRSTPVEVFSLAEFPEFIMNFAG